jgi:hypothetical protein
MYDLSLRKLAFYSLFETGEFLLSRYKVVWKEIASEVACAVQGPGRPDLLTNDNVIPDHKLVVLPCDEEPEAHYVCALLNSAPARFVAQTYIVGTQISTHILEYIKVPPFDTHLRDHARLADLSKRCHVAAANDETTALAVLEHQIDRAAAKVWGITGDELKAIQEALAETRGHKEPPASGEEE